MVQGLWVGRARAFGGGHVVTRLGPENSSDP